MEHVPSGEGVLAYVPGALPKAPVQHVCLAVFHSMHAAQNPRNLLAAPSEYSLEADCSLALNVLENRSQQLN